MSQCQVSSGLIPTPNPGHWHKETMKDAFYVIFSRLNWTSERHLAALSPI